MWAEWMKNFDLTVTKADVIRYKYQTTASFYSKGMLEMIDYLQKLPKKNNPFIKYKKGHDKIVYINGKLPKEIIKDIIIVCDAFKLKHYTNLMMPDEALTVVLDEWNLNRFGKELIFYDK